MRLARRKLLGMTRTNSTVPQPLTIRYSPKPRESYKQVRPGFAFGPATSALLGAPEAWNLAWLSHDYDQCLEPANPNFTVLVRRTCQTRLDGSGLGITDSLDLLVGSLLLRPAPRFVYLIRQSPLLPQLPLYQAYGDAWLQDIEQRSRFCLAEADDEPTVDVVTDLSQAQSLLDRIRQR